MQMATVVDNTLEYFARVGRPGKPLGLGTQVMTMDAAGPSSPHPLLMLQGAALLPF